MSHKLLCLVGTLSMTAIAIILFMIALESGSPIITGGAFTFLAFGVAWGDGLFHARHESWRNSRGKFWGTR